MSRQNEQNRISASEAINETTKELKVWDPMVRLFHWGLLAAFVTAYITQEEYYSLHLYAGYTVLGLISFRILWGLIGTRHARFTDFVYRPSRVVAFVKGHFSGSARRYLGHNPAGGYMILALLLCLAVVTISGVMLDAAENRTGPLSGFKLFYYTDVIDEVHEVSTNVCLGLIVLHVLGVIASSHLYRENLVRAMITGKKQLSPEKIQKGRLHETGI